jgi:DNA-binding MarR family transcriptional regulator
MSTANDMSGRVGYRLKVAQIALRVRMDAALKPVGITAPQYAVLTAIAAEPGVSNAALARAAFVTPQTMQGIVANLERMGLLTRSEHPSHGRILRADLTAKGRAALGRAHALVTDVEDKMLAGLSKADTARLADLLGRCADNLADG